MFCFIITGENVDNIARYKCLACSNERKRSDMVTFAENDYDFDHAIIKYTFLKHGRKIFDNWYYVSKENCIMNDKRHVAVKKIKAFWT